MGEKTVEQKYSNFAGGGSFITDYRCTSEHYQKPAFVGYSDCNCSIHDFTFQDRPFKS